MSATSQSRARHWVLTQDALDTLLTCLAPDRDRAGERYERLRTKLVKFFEWRGLHTSEELADETLNRVARRAAEGEQISNLPAYALGVARRVRLERHTALQGVRTVPMETAHLIAQEPCEIVERRAACLETSLAALSHEDRRLILDYYDHESRAKAGSRQVIAERLGISINALRIRAFRIRTRLE